ncbi:MAG: rhodanese-like domain-containing protein [Candidatus Binatia bacterium]
MSQKVLTPQEVQDALSSNSSAVYIDVRTVTEFATGHPRGKVVNIPIEFYHPTTKETIANASFLEVAQSLYEKDAPLIAGGAADTRATQAAQKLAEAGYTNVCIMSDGFPAWRSAKLPTTTDNRDGISYVSLLTPAKRKGKKKKAAHS